MHKTKDSVKDWRDFLWKRYNITPEDTYMGVNELDILTCMRDDFGWPDYYVLTYTEFTEWVKNGYPIIPYKLNKWQFLS